MNRNYVSGRRFEYKTMSLLQLAGFECVRSAGSHGLWDVTAVGRDGVRLVQVKRGSAKQSADEAEAFRALSVSSQTSKEVWSYAKRGQPPKIVVIP